MRARHFVALGAVFAVACAASCGQSGPKPGTVKDEAMRAGLAPSHFVQNTPDYFHDMDYNVAHGARPAFGRTARRPLRGRRNARRIRRLVFGLT